ncbi:hypothetical protein HO133_008030 [Letharia lupina]|uniref:Apurinic-apyrimidinic endonuclease 1 n=1 Tax=Letharia lupina TaxID=560253 RepID=A0A8H6CR12_9LECA|nr:uncharacterized protein HO133_008030 [Letharia lupina]KAF6228300.1 hypothetical protein HO133_008030 [Letharia lupina]
MTASERLADPAQASPKSQTRTTAANAAVDPTTSKRTPRAIRSLNKTTRLEANGVEDKDTPRNSGKGKKIAAVITEAAPSALPEGATPKKTKQRKEVKPKTEDTQEQEPQAEDISTKAKRNPKLKEDLESADPQIDGSIHKTAKRKRIVKGEEVETEGSEPSPKKTKRKKATDVEIDETVENEASPRKARRKTKVKEEDEEVQEGGEGQKKTKRKRKTKEEKEIEAMPLATRTDGLRMFIGAHVSGAKGVHNSVTNCVHIGGNAFAMFLKSQKKWENPPLQDDHRDQFKAFCGEHEYDAASHILPHGSYLVNLAQEDPEKATQAYNAFLDDLNRCESLGIRLYNFHPGWTGSHPRPSAIARIAKALNRAHAATKTVTPVLETMAGGGNVIGSTFEDLRDIIALVDDKNRIGVCLDTCHVHAAGYDLRKPVAFQKTLDDFDKIVGVKYLCALHLNDSKAPFSSHRDLHQNIGLGFLGLRAFWNVMNEPRFEGLPMVLETPIDHKDEETGKDVEDKAVWAREIKMLEGLIGVDADGDEFKAMEKELADKGAEERAKYQEQFERKGEKDKKALEKGQKKLQFGKTKTEKAIKNGSDSEA